VYRVYFKISLYSLMATLGTETSIMPNEYVIYVFFISAVFATVHTGKKEWQSQKWNISNLNKLNIAVKDDDLFIHHSYPTVK